jgi:hypothetical protein
MKQILVGLPDTGVNRDQARFLSHQQRFELDASGAVVMQMARGDSCGHGTTLARIITATAPCAGILSAEVFDTAGPAAPAVIAAGLEWLVEQGAVIVNMSFGLRADREVLRAACTTASRADVLLVAAVPARGDAVYPAAYPGVLRVTGDARCRAGEFSRLEESRVDFGACPGLMEHTPHQPGSGSSLAAAHVTGELAAHLCSGGSVQSAKSWLRDKCKYIGREIRQ